MKEYRSAPKKTDTVVVFVHGIIEGPDQFWPLVRMAEKKGYAVENLLLPGHGGDGKAFAKSGRKAWESYVKQRLDLLRSKYPQILFVGHSMGTLLELEAAVENPQGIRRAYFMAMPLRIRLTWRGIRTGLKVALNKVDKEDLTAVAAQKAYSIKQSMSPRYFTWIPRYLELFSMIRKARKQISQFPGKMWIVTAEKDELVSPRSLAFLEGNQNARIVRLPSSGHFYYTPEDFQTIKISFEQFLEGER